MRFHRCLGLRQKTRYNVVLLLERSLGSSFQPKTGRVSKSPLPEHLPVNLFGLGVLRRVQLVKALLEFHEIGILRVRLQRCVHQLGGGVQVAELLQGRGFSELRLHVLWVDLQRLVRAGRHLLVDGLGFVLALALLGLGGELQVDLGQVQLDGQGDGVALGLVLVAEVEHVELREVLQGALVPRRGVLKVAGLEDGVAFLLVLASQFDPLRFRHFPVVLISVHATFVPPLALLFCLLVKLFLLRLLLTPFFVEVLAAMLLELPLQVAEAILVHRQGGVLIILGVLKPLRGLVEDRGDYLGLQQVAVGPREPAAHLIDRAFELVTFVEA
mmetsp:Transcript_23546/g.65997  ORF Transcript_23546/g.65997 Transcript_23546/m.65997 type:complete len:328 (+) Transcript_23546:20-1003(+)